MGKTRFPPHLREELSQRVKGELRWDEPMSRRTTFRIGGPADGWFAPIDALDLVRAISFCEERSIPISVVGRGSNLLVRDGGIRGLIIATKSLKRLERRGETTVRVDAGLSTSRILDAAIAWELGGLEFLGGIPGSVGGGLKMNAGTYLGEWKDVTKSVTTVRLSTGESILRSAAECGFGYRTSAIPEGELIVTAELELVLRPASTVRKVVEELRARRAEREPKGFANAGSIWKNPPGHFAGKLIEDAGLKRTRVGAAEISSRHANWIVNLGGATAKDVLALGELVRESVAGKFGIALEMELKIMGEDI